MSDKFRVVETEFSWLNSYNFPLIVINDEVDMISAPYLIGLLNKNLSLGTIRLKAFGIVMFYRFCEAEKIDFPKMMMSLTNFKIGQIEALSAYLKAKQDTGELVEEQTYKARIIAIKAFIFYWWDTYQSRASNDANKLRHAKDKREVMVNSFALELNVPWHSASKTHIGLEPELRALFWEIINPYSTLNPFKYEPTKWRNYVVFITLGLGGNRRGESTLLRIQDVQTTGREKFFEVVKDPKKVAAKTGHKINPSVKTKGRKVALSEDIADIFRHYITKERKKFKGHLKSDFLFLSTRGGKPLSLQAVNRMTEKIIEAYPAFKDALSPHRLRNTYHDLLYDSLDNSPEQADLSPMMKQAMKKRLQEYAGGWSPGSKMTDQYPAGSIERKVWDRTVALQKDALGELENGE
ncbi:site-specific integrase [Marinimicrobium sp. ABcell2]|uniref:site-specific integrase n=1 Tax=Marinimicrobium sp. ABcell2 TaxID=3069751 RepID=UPI0027B66774|nr:site-specific integrase [Marinimicrobium sp. ABcell2]MDQ2077469.1 site-specific integrase [Marinimicrobium sp. ABcell2]